MISLALPDFAVTNTACLGNTLFVTITANSTAAKCPDCEHVSHRIHSRYVRQLKDLPVQGRAVELRVVVRRFRCANPRCGRKTFAESLGTLAARYAQRTSRLTEILRALILRVSSITGAYLAERLGIPTSPRTLLRVVDRDSPAVGRLRVVGIDDLALRRGRTYATLVCDLETGRPVDLIDGRNTEPVQRWLEAHSNIEVVARDRATSYAHAVQTAVPGALQVADRFHLVRNVMDALKEVVDRKRWALPLVSQAAPRARLVPEPSDAYPNLPKPSRQQALKDAAARRRRERYEEIHRRHELGQTARAIAQAMGLARGTVAKYLRSPEVPLYSPRRPRFRKIDPFMSYLQERWEAGCHNARRLYDEVVALGYSGAQSTVRHVLGNWRTHDKALNKDPAPALTLRWRDLRWLALSPPERLNSYQKEQLETLLELNPTLRSAHTLA